MIRLWNLSNTTWADANWKWSDPIPPIPVVVIGNQPGVDAETLIQPWQLEEPWNPYRNDKKKRLIKLICRMNGREYIEEREAREFPVKIGNVRTMVNTTTNIDLNFKLEE